MNIGLFIPICNGLALYNVVLRLALISSNNISGFMLKTRADWNGSIKQSDGNNSHTWLMKSLYNISFDESN